MQTLRPYVYLLGVAVALTLTGCKQEAIQPAPLPAPEPQATPAMPVQQNLSADALFAFGKAQLKAADNADLDALVDKLKAASQIDSVHVLGYTDRIGSEQANLDLSAKRAEAVRDYPNVLVFTKLAPRPNGTGCLRKHGRSSFRSACAATSALPSIATSSESIACSPSLKCRRRPNRR